MGPMGEEDDDEEEEEEKEEEEEEEERTRLTRGKSRLNLARNNRILVLQICKCP